MIKVTKIKEETKEFNRIYYKLEQVKTYEPNIVNKIIAQTKGLIATGELYGELGHNNGLEINLYKVTHKIISIEKLNDTDIKIISHVFPISNVTNTLLPELIACVENKTYELHLSYTLRGCGNDYTDDFHVITCDLADENNVGKNPIFLSKEISNTITKEQALL